MEFSPIRYQLRFALLWATWNINIPYMSQDLRPAKKKCTVRPTQDDPSSCQGIYCGRIPARDMSLSRCMCVTAFVMKQNASTRPRAPTMWLDCAQPHSSWRITKHLSASPKAVRRQQTTYFSYAQDNSSAPETSVVNPPSTHRPVEILVAHPLNCLPEVRKQLRTACPQTNPHELRQSASRSRKHGVIRLIFPRCHVLVFELHGVLSQQSTAQDQ